METLFFVYCKNIIFFINTAVIKILQTIFRFLAKGVPQIFTASW